jgi:hypothetical protein
MKGTLVALLACVMAFAFGALAQEARGSGAAAQANCERNEYLGVVYHWIQVTAPRLDPTTNQLVYPNGYVVTNPLQWVKYRAHLYRYQSGRWTKLQSSPFYWTQVSGANLSGAWYNDATRRWERGDHRFDIPLLGGWAYRVSAEYQWVPFYDAVGSMYVPEQWLAHIDDRKDAYYLSQVAYCVY